MKKSITKLIAASAAFLLLSSNCLNPLMAEKCALSVKVFSSPIDICQETPADSQPQSDKEEDDELIGAASGMALMLL